MEKEAIVDAVRDYLDDDDWNYEFDAEEGLIRAGLVFDCKLKSAYLRIRIRETSYNVYIVLKLNADKETLPEIIRYTTMANYGLLSGNFEVDVEDGEIRYKSFVDTMGIDRISREIVKGSIYRGWNTVERYGNGLAALLLGFSDAETEIGKAEKEYKRLERDCQREIASWEELKTPDKLRVALLRHGLDMSQPNQDQVVHMTRAGKPEPNQMSVARIRQRNARGEMAAMRGLPHVRLSNARLPKQSSSVRR